MARAKDGEAHGADSALTACVGKESSRYVPKGSEQALHRLQKAAAPVKSPANAGLFLGALRAPFPGLLLASSWEGRQVRSWLMEEMKLLQEMLGRHRRAHWQKRVTDGEKPQAGMNFIRSSCSSPRPASHPRGAAHSTDFCYCSNLPRSSLPS